MSDDAKALARAVLDGDDAAVLVLMDALQAERGLDTAREWIRLWDDFAGQALAGLMAIPAGRDGYWDESHRRADQKNISIEDEVARDCYRYADGMMAERARRMRERKNK